MRWLECLLVALLPAACTPGCDGVAIMPLGDSITDGTQVPGGYRISLLRELDRAGLRANLVGSQRNGPSTLRDHDHEGHGGYRIAMAAAELDGWVQQNPPDVVVLLLGTNDMIHDDDVAGAPARLDALLQQLADRLPDATTYVGTVPPLADSAGHARVKVYNAQVKEVVRQRAEQGGHVHLVDIYSRLDVADLLDGIHPTREGYAKIGRAWADALVDRPRPPAPPWE